MIVSRETLAKQAGEYRPEIFEKVLYLMRRVEMLNGHLYLSESLGLKWMDCLQRLNLTYRGSRLMSTTITSVQRI